jgi:hypothetical protein
MGESARNPTVRIRVAATRAFSYHIKTDKSWIYFILEDEAGQIFRILFPQRGREGVILSGF